MLATRMRQAAGGGGVVYLLRDEFTTNEAAPLVSPRTCEPGPGTLTITDPGPIFSISGGKLVWNSAVTPGNSTANSAAFARAVGRAVMATWIPTSQNSQFGWMAGAVRWYALDMQPSAAGSAVLNNANVSSVSPTITAGQTYTPAVIQRSVGAFFVLGSTLAYVAATGSDASLNTTIFRINFATNVHSVDDLRVIDLPAPWNTDYGIATNRTESPGDGATTTSEANAIVEVTITGAAGVTQELDVRRTDDDNRWIVRMDQAGSTIKLIERNAGVETERSSAAQTWTNGTAYRVVVIQDGNTIKTFVADTLKNNYASATFNNTATGVKISHAASNLIAWPRTLNGAALAALEAV